MTQGRIIGRGGGKFPDGYWQSFRWMPHPGLALQVRGYNGYFESSSRPVRRRELPSGEVALIISLGPQWRLIDPATGVSARTLRTFAAGLDDTYSLVESEIPGAAIQVDFTPIGARQLLQLPMHLVSKRTTELTDLLGSEADRLVEQLAEAPDWHSRFLTLKDADAHYARAKAAGAKIVHEIEDASYGGRGYSCRDLEGHFWSFGSYDPWG